MLIAIAVPGGLPLAFPTKRMAAKGPVRVLDPYQMNGECLRGLHCQDRHTYTGRYAY